MDFPFSMPLFTTDKRQMRPTEDECTNYQWDDMIPSVPVPPTDSFGLNKSSFDFGMSQVITAFPNDEAQSKSKKLLSQQIEQPCNRRWTIEKTRYFGLKPEISTPTPLLLSDFDGKGKPSHFRSVDEIPTYRHVFRFPFFNILQSKVLDEVLYTDRSVVVSSPTGSGKTVVFEIALVRLLMKTENVFCGKIIYMAPMKALCTERFQDWTEKFPQLKCVKVTGDTEMDDDGVTNLKDVNLICTTPEKWDSLSRRWKDKKGFFHGIRLFFIDEIHTLNDSNRGATIEAVVSRMKTLQTASNLVEPGCAIRFIAVSATLPNYNDIAEWLSTSSKPASAYNIEEKHRPVKLERFVLGYPFKKGSSDFRFDMNLSYRLRGIIDTYCHGKPTLVFCSSRKSVIQSGEILAKTVRMHSLLTHFNPVTLQQAAQTVHEQKVSELLYAGIGVHHAGLPMEDRQTVEELFRTSKLPVLISTSTLAMGVNLPAHLVIIKSTHCYNMGTVEEYSDMQLLQMIGRAGRPQFDTSATAVIMTKTINKSRYECLVKGTQLVESSLHKNLIEHLNAEIVLQTITDMALAVEWMRQTFLYVRVLKNPKFYGLPVGLSKSEVEKRLQDLCLKNLNLLTGLRLVSVEEESYEIVSQETGRLMARYCIAFETMKHFHKLQDHQESIANMLQVLSECAEFEDIQLRTNEKRILNSLNRDKFKDSIRFPLPGKIKSKQMKVNCLLQAQLGCLTVQDFSLSQDIIKIFRVGQRVAKCLMEFLYQQGNKYSLLLHAILLYKGLKTRLWFDSTFVSRQLDGIGNTMSLALVTAGLNSFQMLDQAHPRDIELIVNRHPPFGNQIKESVSKLPRYELAIEQVNTHACGKAVLSICIDLLNRTRMEREDGGDSINRGLRGFVHQALLLIGDEDKSVVFKWRIMDKNLVEGPWTRRVEIKRALAGPKLNINLLSLEWVGLDIQTEYEPVYAPGWTKPQIQHPASKLKEAMNKASQNKAPGNKTKTTTKASKRLQTPCAKMGGSSCSKQAKVTLSTSTPAKANILSDILQDMEKTFHPNVARITLDKFAYTKPKSLSHIREVDCGQQANNKIGRSMTMLQPSTENNSLLLNSSDRNKDQDDIGVNDHYNHADDFDGNWSDEIYMWDGDIDLTLDETKPALDALKETWNDNNTLKLNKQKCLTLNEPLTLRNKSFHSSKTTDFQFQPCKDIVNQKEENFSHSVFMSKNNVVEHDLPTKRKRKVESIYSGKGDKTSEGESMKVLKQTSHSYFNPRMSSSTLCSNILIDINSASSSSSNVLDMQMSPQISPGRKPYSQGPEVSYVMEKSFQIPPDQKPHLEEPEVPFVMGNNVDDFMRQMGYIEQADDSSSTQKKINTDSSKIVPSTSPSDEELYHLTEEHELSHFLHKQDILSNPSILQDSSSPCDPIEVNSNPASFQKSPCHVTTKLTKTAVDHDNYHTYHQSGFVHNRIHGNRTYGDTGRNHNGLNIDNSSFNKDNNSSYNNDNISVEMFSSHISSRNNINSDSKHNDNDNNSSCNNNNSRSYNNDKISMELFTPHGRYEDYEDGMDEISWSPLSTQLSQQIPPQPVTVLDHSRNCRPHQVESSSTDPRMSSIQCEDDLNSKSPHRFGLVQAWPRISKSHVALRSPLVEKNNPKAMKTQTASMFQNTSEPYVPGKLFDGIFESLL